jgi:hypothetical protein
MLGILVQCTTVTNSIEHVLSTTKHAMVVQIFQQQILLWVLVVFKMKCFVETIVVTHTDGVPVPRPLFMFLAQPLNVFSVFVVFLTMGGAWLSLLPTKVVNQVAWYANA